MGWFLPVIFGGAAATTATAYRDEIGSWFSRTFNKETLNKATENPAETAQGLLDSAGNVVDSYVDGVDSLRQTTEETIEKGKKLLNSGEKALDYAENPDKAIDAMLSSFSDKASKGPPASDGDLENDDEGMSLLSKFVLGLGGGWLGLKGLGKIFGGKSGNESSGFGLTGLLVLGTVLGTIYANRDHLKQGYDDLAAKNWFGNDKPQMATVPSYDGPEIS